jgi:hypothetical protein
MKVNKDKSMLIDIQYIKPNKREGNPDYLYIIWKDLETNEKHMQAIPEPLMKVYFEKPEFRNHNYNKNYARLETLNGKVCKYKDIIFAIAEDMGDVGKQKLQNYFNTGNYRGLKEFFIYPYVYGADYDIRVWYRLQWLLTYDNDEVKHLSKGFLDIEVDSMEAVGMPDPVFCPIDLITIIDEDKSQSYTFSLIGVDCKDKDTTQMNQAGKEREMERRMMYAHRLKEQEYWSTHVDELKEKAHEMFDENYPGMEYNFYFYTDERKMLVHLFQLINTLKLDMIEIWNIGFDMPYIINRLEALGLDPKQVMCHPDFPVKECWFKKDTINFAVKNKADYMHLSSYTIFTDQMRNYAAIRKGGSELRSNRLTYIAQKEINDEKLDYSEDGNIKTVSYRNFLIYILYNIKDVLLQKGIEERTSDLDTYYLTSYKNITPYESEFKQTVKLRNVQYKSFWQQGLIPGENVNGFLYNYESREEDDDEDDDDDKKKDDVGFEGALVGNPLLIEKFGDKLFGKRTNSIFKYSVDFDMSAFYPSTIRAMNIDPSTLIFKMILDSSQYDVRGGDMPFHGITDMQMVAGNKDSFEKDISKEVMDNFQTQNYLFFGHKWLNLPDVNQVYERLKKELG